ncbi:DUF3306 domain-containing protein [Pararhizobium haloflavum]|uniref:DUF3306 domain-containing protein n=1 Tax=Pararhizobium haloflavum TaxID=2037914 RepID=UPI000C19D25C|nr:DUF3306 domain-containing protein [Pararhizobium haloflavum]
MSDEPQGDDEKGFLARWSRRKRDALRPDEVIEAPAEASAPDQVFDEQAGDDDDDAISQEEIDALPPIDSVTDRAGLDPFFRKGVPAGLRNAARRRMWLLNPKINGYLDVARDYAYDWNTPGGVPGSGGRVASAAAAKLVDAMFSSGDWRQSAQKPEVRPLQEDQLDEAELVARDESESEGDGDAALPDLEDTAPDVVAARSALSTSTTFVVDDDGEEPEPVSTASEARSAKRHGGAKPR